MRLRRRLLVLALLGCVGAWLWLRWLERSHGEEPYSLIEDGLYVGGAVARPPPGTQAVLNLCAQEDPYRVDRCLWERIDGSQELSIEWLRRVVGFIDAQRRAGRTTYVHCLAGMNRSGMVVTAYLMHEHGWGRDRALAFAQSKRPQIQPNPTLMRLLAEWEGTLMAQRSQGTVPGRPRSTPG
jgi:hypothetical protein